MFTTFPHAARPNSTEMGSGIKLELARFVGEESTADVL